MSRPLLHLTFKYIKLIDIYKLFQLGIHSHYHKFDIEYIKQRTIHNIHKRLKYLLEDKYEKFIYYLKKSNASISGSFILQCMLDEYWDNSDIDIYITEELKKNKKNKDRICYLCNDKEEHNFSVLLLAVCFLPFKVSNGYVSKEL